MDQNETFLFLTPEVERFLSENEFDTKQLLQKSGYKVEVRLGQNPAFDSAGKKEPVTILLASAAVIAALTPAVRELIRNLSGRDVVVRERRLVPVESSKGDVVRDASGAPVLHWVDVVKGLAPDPAPQPIKIRGFGIEISFGGKK
jgi:hypothetical protein